MFIRFLLVSVAAAVCALWPQGIILCAEEHGHVEFEIGGGECCPADTDDCDDCVDTESPELTGTPAGVAVAAPALIFRSSQAPTSGAAIGEGAEPTPPLPVGPDEQHSAPLLI